MSLKVPLGFDKTNNTYVSPLNATKIDSYQCPSCEGDLTFRAGDINVKHFAHKKDTDCSYDNLIHKLAQLIILENTEILVNDAIVKYTNPRLEVTVGNYRCDASIDTDRYPGLMIEVVVTNALTNDKLKALSNLNILEIDLRGYAPIDDFDTLKKLVLYAPETRNLITREREPDEVKKDDLFKIIVGVLILFAGLGARVYYKSRNRKKRRY